ILDLRGIYNYKYQELIENVNDLINDSSKIKGRLSYIEKHLNPVAVVDKLEDIKKRFVKSITEVERRQEETRKSIKTSSQEINNIFDKKKEYDQLALRYVKDQEKLRDKVDVVKLDKENSVDILKDLQRQKIEIDKAQRGYQTFLTSYNQLDEKFKNFINSLDSLELRKRTLIVDQRLTLNTQLKEIKRFKKEIEGLENVKEEIKERAKDFFKYLLNSPLEDYEFSNYTSLLTDFFANFSSLSQDFGNLNFSLNVKEQHVRQYLPKETLRKQTDFKKSSAKKNIHKLETCQLDKDLFKRLLSLNSELNEFISKSMRPEKIDFLEKEINNYKKRFEELIKHNQRQNIILKKAQTVLNNYKKRENILLQVVENNKEEKNILRLERQKVQQEYNVQLLVSRRLHERLKSSERYFQCFVNELLKVEELSARSNYDQIDQIGSNPLGLVNRSPDIQGELVFQDQGGLTNRFKKEIGSVIDNLRYILITKSNNEAILRKELLKKEEETDKLRQEVANLNSNLSNFYTDLQDIKTSVNETVPPQPFTLIANDEPRSVSHESRVLLDKQRTFNFNKISENLKKVVSVSAFTGVMFYCTIQKPGMYNKFFDYKSDRSLSSIQGAVNLDFKKVGPELEGFLLRHGLLRHDNINNLVEKGFIPYKYLCGLDIKDFSFLLKNNIPAYKLISYEDITSISDRLIDVKNEYNDLFIDLQQELDQKDVFNLLLDLKRVVYNQGDGFYKRLYHEFKELGMNSKEAISSVINNEKILYGKFNEDILIDYIGDIRPIQSLEEMDLSSYKELILPYMAKNYHDYCKNRGIKIRDDLQVYLTALAENMYICSKRFNIPLTSLLTIAHQESYFVNILGDGNASSSPFQIYRPTKYKILTNMKKGGFSIPAKVDKLEDHLTMATLMAAFHFRELLDRYSIKVNALNKDKPDRIVFNLDRSTISYNGGRTYARKVLAKHAGLLRYLKDRS
ncbi:MAG: hypothetical protein V1872_15125, partial [bacterium]